MTPYRTDLAHIRDEGFGHLAAAAAQVLVAELDAAGIDRGTVVDLGCGSGITARILTDAGYGVIGVDLSEALIALARKRAPAATFQVGSFIDAQLPPCVAVCAVGEVLNYAFDDRSGDTSRSALITDAFAALEAGGHFLLDVAGPGRAPEGVTRTFTEGEGWAVLLETSTTGTRLVRRITSFRRHGDLYRRNVETHELRLIARDRMERELRTAGFSVDALRAYGSTPLPTGLHGFVARKPSLGSRSL